MIIKPENRQSQSYQHYDHAGQHHKKKLNNGMTKGPKSSALINRTTGQNLYGANHQTHHLYQQLHLLQKFAQRHLQEKDELTQYPQQKRMGHYSEAALEHYQHPLQISKCDITVDVSNIYRAQLIVEKSEA
jgi:hypothetical protein